jgi:hypothetical protein
VRGFGEAGAGSDLAQVGPAPGFVVIAAASWNHVAAMRVSMRERGGAG